MKSQPARSAVEKGTLHEMEHSRSIEKISGGKLTTAQAARLIAMDHLRENPDYYDILEELKLQDGGVITGQLHSECNAMTGCGEKFMTLHGMSVEAERGEGVVPGDVFDAFGNRVFKIEGTPAEIVSAVNAMGGSGYFKSGAKVFEGSEPVKISNKPKKSEPSRYISSGTYFINRRSMADKNKYEFTGTLQQIISAVNTLHSPVDTYPGARVRKFAGGGQVGNRYTETEWTEAYGFLHENGEKKSIKINKNQGEYCIYLIDYKVIKMKLDEEKINAFRECGKINIHFYR